MLPRSCRLPMDAHTCFRGWIRSLLRPSISGQPDPRRSFLKNLGPFEIIMQPGTHSCTLRLPETMRAIHLVFHVSQLEPSVPNTIPNHVQPPPPLIEIDGKPEFEIAEILDLKIDCRRCNCTLLYLVRWLGCEGMEDETSWLLATELGHTSDLVSDFHSRYLDKPGPHRP